MNIEVWKAFYKKTRGLSKINSIKGLINSKDISEYQNLIKNALHEFVTNRELHLGLKIYLNSVLHNEYNAIIRDTPLCVEDTMENWMNKVFKGQKFGIILNYIETLNDNFTRKAVADVQPLLQLAGMPLGGLSFLCFIGNYGFTPFGIHKEASGEEGFLFHLGPGIKKFYAWDKEEYNKIEHNTKVFHNVEDWLPKATCYVLEPGDAMFIPHNVYHIADTPEFSLSFVMDFINPPTDDIEKELIQNLGQLNFKTKNRKYYAPLNKDKKLGEWNQLLDFIPIQKRFNQAFDDLILSLKSNAGIKHPSIKKHKIQIPSNNFSFQIVSPFPLFFNNRENGTYIFARGHQIKTKQHLELEEIIKMLNEGKQLTRTQLQNILCPQWDLMDLFSLLSELLIVQAIEVID